MAHARRPGADTEDELTADDAVSPDAPTAPVPRLYAEGEIAPHVPVRLFGTHAFFRLWLAQVVSALGDWIGFFAIVTIADRIGGSSSGAAIGVVMMARILPGFFLAPVAGVLLDRWDRKRVMVACDIGRAVVLAFLPFVDTIPQLVAASFLLEVLTLMWSPAKEATVPNLVPMEHLATANSLSLAAAYGTFPIASAIFAGLAKVADRLGQNESLSSLSLNQETLAVWFDVVTFLLSAFLISTLTFVRPRRERTSTRRINFGETFQDLKEGWQFIFVNPIVRAVMVGVGTGLIGGGMLVPLGPVFTSQVLGAGPAGFGLLLTALGTGVALGVLLVSVLQKRLPKTQVFSGAVVVAGSSLLLGACASTLLPALIAVLVLGISAGFVYVLGYTILQENVSDDLRGRTFTALYTVVRLSLLLAFAIGPFLADALEKLSDRFLNSEVTVGDVGVAVPGVRLTLWLAGVIIIFAGLLSARTLRGAKHS